ncbi:hypothetical protein ACOMHN_062291 [Nucella lapillus]
MPPCAEIHDAMQCVTDVAFLSSEQQIQHNDLSKARQMRDHKDADLILKYLLDRSPFSGDASLRSIYTGRVAEATVDVHQAETIGKQILSSMVGKTALDISFRKKAQAVTMAVKGTLSKPKEEVIHVDPMLLFQRLVKIAANTPDCLEDAFAFEMSNIPTSLFDSDGLPRQPKKASLASYIWTATQQASAELPENKVHVIDGGYLLHLLSWARGCTYNAIAQSYIDSVKRMFGKGIVVFDGYSSNPSTKDIAHLRQKQRTKVASDFVFDGETLLSVPKENFLANENNKGRFISLLSSHLLNNGFDTIHASADADCRIVHTTLETAKQHNVVLIGEDTDLLILILHHCTPDHHPVFFTSTRSSSAKVWDIQAVQSVLGEDVCKHILFAHAIGGCDTVSGLLSIGKSIPFKKYDDFAMWRFCSMMILSCDDFAVSQYDDFVQYNDFSLWSFSILRVLINMMLDDEKSLVLLFGWKVTYWTEVQLP